jgi:hypothetical protein
MVSAIFLIPVESAIPNLKMPPSLAREFLSLASTVKDVPAKKIARLYSTTTPPAPGTEHKGHITKVA